MAFRGAMPRASTGTLKRTREAFPAAINVIRFGPNFPKLLYREWLMVRATDDLSLGLIQKDAT
jgi:hypothetical protein